MKFFILFLYFICSLSLQAADNSKTIFYLEDLPINENLDYKELESFFPLSIPPNESKFGLDLSGVYLCQEDNSYFSIHHQGGRSLLLVNISRSPDFIRDFFFAARNETDKQIISKKIEFFSFFDDGIDIYSYIVERTETLNACLSQIDKYTPNDGLYCEESDDPNFYYLQKKRFAEPLRFIRFDPKTSDKTGLYKIQYTDFKPLIPQAYGNNLEDISLDFIYYKGLPMQLKIQGYTFSDWYAGERNCKQVY